MEVSPASPAGAGAPAPRSSHGPALGIVAIGRNEGERLVRCLRSLEDVDATIVYVDSASTDGSPRRAALMGATVVDLDMTLPFTAARARNAGFAALPGCTFVQFIDGDCELEPGWLPAATAFLNAHPDVAVACGRRKERHPDASVYNALCDIEWDTPVGEAAACGGDSLMRADAVRAVGGFRDDLTAGEEPELCARLRHAGWRVFRLDEPMTRHDAAMRRFGQWWRRSMRGGFGYAQAAAVTRDLPHPLYTAEVRRVLIWGGILPLAALLNAVFVHAAFLLAPVVLMGAQVARLTWRDRWRGRMAAPHATFTMLAKLPEFHGIMRFALSRRTGSAITYK